MFIINLSQWIRSPNSIIYKGTKEGLYAYLNVYVNDFVISKT